jgi:energy-coupling factor transporter ATP-binding protein EcfA2
MLELIKSIFDIGKTGVEISNSSDLAKRFLSRVYKRIKQGKLILLIFGAGGVGKTTLSKLLSGEDKYTLATNYTESTFIEKVELPGNVPCVLMIAPGQRLSKRFVTTWLDLFEEANKSQSRLIINVVSYGFHAFQTAGYKEVTTVYKDGMSKESFMEAFCEQKRGEELHLLQKLVEGIDAKAERFTLLTIVTKADLWWDNRQKVMDFYEIGEYHHLLAPLYKNTNSTKFDHVVIPLSLTLNNFQDENDEILANTARGYDLDAHKKLIDNLYNQISKLIELK